MFWMVFKNYAGFLKKDLFNEFETLGRIDKLERMVHRNLKS